MDYRQHAQPQAPHADLPTPNGKSADGGVTASLPSLLSNGQMEQVGGPVSAAWREGTLTRAKELESLCAWVVANYRRPGSEILAQSVYFHIEAAREAARADALNPQKRLHLLRYGPLRERAMSNLDAAEAQLLNIAPA